MADNAQPLKASAGWRTDLAAFWRGFTEPSALAFRLFVVSALLTLGLCIWFFSEATIGGWFGRFLPRSGLDAEGFATKEALQAAQEDAKFPRLFLLGTSTVAQAVGSGKALEQLILGLTGQEWRVVVLTTPLQSPVDQFALLDRALQNQRADSPPVVVAIGFGLQRLRWTSAQTLALARDRRIGLRSDWEDDEVRVLGGKPLRRTGFYPVDNSKFVLVNGSEALLRLVLHKPATRLVDQYAIGVKPPPSQQLRDLIGSGIRENFPTRATYFTQIERLAVDLSTRPNTSLVLIEEPLSPALIENQGLQQMKDQMSRELADFAAHHNFGYWPVNSEARMPSKSYFDDLHVLAGPEQDQLRVILARHMKQFLSAREDARE